MKISKTTIIIALWTLFFISIQSILSSVEARSLIKVDGSSTVYPITEAVAEEFQKEKQNRDIRITVGISGTGGGFKKFGRGETDISDASRPIKPTEVKLCKKNGVEYIELPVAFDGLAVMVNPKNTWVEYMTVAELKKLWEPAAQRKITRWNQIRPGWPKEKITLAGPGVDSGTYDYFTRAIVGKEGASRGDFIASEDDNVLVQAIANDKYAIGFFGLAYYEENKDKLKLVPIDDGNKENGAGPVLPSLETVKSGIYQPLSRPIFIYVNKRSAERPEVEKFVQFYLLNAKTLTREVGYIPLPDDVYKLVLERFQKRVTGSVFGGKGATVGVEIDEILRRESN
ncbi:MAG: PstS family phosphate ABC transporter substrate-binding protein [Candidatus Poribacteria bacterium]